MRNLRVIGVDADLAYVVCEDAESKETFRIPADDRLRAAARGDATRLGQIEIEMDSALRPRDIQARIRAGATVAQVAATAGVPIDRVERFAHPVLLERQRVAELASLAHPVRADGPTLEGLGEVVAAALTGLGHNPDHAVWDAWKADDGKWVVQIGWQAGRSQTFAHWRYLPGSNGGTVESLDEPAAELVDPDFTRPPLRGLVSMSAPSAETEPAPPELDFQTGNVTVSADAITGAQRARVNATFNNDESQQIPEPAAADEPTAHPRKRKGVRTPSVPAWEDVLLGVRSNGNS